MHTIPDGYSTTVDAYLIVGDRRFSVANIGPDRCIVRSPELVRPTAAELVLRIDGDEQRWYVFLVDGISPDTGHVQFRDL